jgi:hypothetical protein
MYRLPPRLPVGDAVEGSLITLDEHLLLVQTPPAEASITHAGPMILRYALVYLGRSYHAIVPELVAMDTGGGFSGEEAWDFLINKSNLFPRADVIGYREDGQEDMVTVKSLDLAAPVRTFVYSDESSRTPIGVLSAIVMQDTSQLPPRVLEYCAHYSTLEDWQKRQ